MHVGARVYKAKKLETILLVKGRKTSQSAKGRIRVGYAAPYAKYVHELVGMVLAGLPRPSGNGTYWSPKGAQAKFLEQPSRMFAKDIGSFITAQVKQKIPVLKAMAKAGLILLRESKRLVPVDTGRLISSGYVKVEES